MKRNFRNILLCLLAAALAGSAGTAYAADIAGIERDASADTDDAAADETENTDDDEPQIELSEADAARLLTKIGSADGLDFYRKSKDYKNEIWALHGGDPTEKDDYDKNAEPTPEQLAAEADIALIKPLGELVAVDTAAGRAVADFDDWQSCSDSERIYRSGDGAFLVYTDEEVTNVRKLRRAVSVQDYPRLFMTADGNTLELMDEKFSAAESVFTYSKAEDGRLVFTAEDDSFAWLGSDRSSVLGVFTCAAENDKYRMLVDSRSALIGLEVKENGYIWWSSPLDAGRDEKASPTQISELRSSGALRYGIPENRSQNYVRSYSDDCKVTVSSIKDGVRINYDYFKVGISYPVEYKLAEDCLAASLKISELRETNKRNIATEVTIMGSFGAAGSDEEGCFVIPDGCGALMRFNNGKAEKNPYSQRVYGDDVTAVPSVKTSVTQQIYLPMYGIIKGDNAMLTVASGGDSNAVLSAQLPEQSGSSYNLCGFTFILRGTDTFYMPGSVKEEFTVFEGGNIKSDDIELKYFPITAENADFTDIAARYRAYLTDEDGVKVRTRENCAPLYLDLYGGTMKKRSVLGIPVTMKTRITGFSDAKEIVSQLADSGVDDMVISYNNWTSDGIRGRVDTDASPSGMLGGKGGFAEFSDYAESCGFTLYPQSDSRTFLNGNGYYSFTGTAVRISGAYSRIVSYDRAYGIPDGFKKNRSLLSPKLFGEVLGDTLKSYDKSGLGGISLGSMTTSLYGDYGKKAFSRGKALSALTDSLGDFDTTLGNGILADGANAYALPFVTHITDMPMCSGGYDMFDEDVPLYQTVIHGIIPYSTPAVNGDADSETLLLMAAATGCNVRCDMIYEETSELKDTDLDVLFYANYSAQITAAAAEYRLISDVLSGVSDCTIEGYSRENSVITTTYSNGTVIVTDLENKTITENGTCYDLSEIAGKGGFRF